MLTDKRWQKLLQVMKSTGRIYNKSEHRMTFEGILYRMRTGVPWRDLPKEFGDWNTVYRRFNLWSKKGLLDILFKELSKLSDYDWVFADGSIVKLISTVQEQRHQIMSVLEKVAAVTQRKFIWLWIAADYQSILSYQKAREMILLVPRALLTALRRSTYLSLIKAMTVKL